MIGDAALTWTIVVENVTEPKPALLHYSPGAIPLGGMRNDECNKSLANQVPSPKSQVQAPKSKPFQLNDPKPEFQGLFRSGRGSAIGT